MPDADLDEPEFAKTSEQDKAAWYQEFGKLREELGAKLAGGNQFQPAPICCDASDACPKRPTPTVAPCRSPTNDVERGFLLRRLSDISS
jgi:hypothetical protein